MDMFPVLSKASNLKSLCITHRKERVPSPTHRYYSEEREIVCDCKCCNNSCTPVNDNYVLGHGWIQQLPFTTLCQNPLRPTSIYDQMISLTPSTFLSLSLSTLWCELWRGGERGEGGRKMREPTWKSWSGWPEIESWWAPRPEDWHKREYLGGKEADHII